MPVSYTHLGLTVLELNDLVKACEEEFGVSAAAGVVCLLYTSNIQYGIA